MPCSPLNHALHVFTTANPSSFNNEQKIALASLASPNRGGNLYYHIKWIQNNSAHYRPSSVWQRTYVVDSHEAMKLQRLETAFSWSISNFNGHYVPMGYEGHLDPATREEWEKKNNELGNMEKGEEDVVPPREPSTHFGFHGDAFFGYCLPPGCEDAIFAPYYPADTSRQTVFNWEGLPTELKESILEAYFKCGQIRVLPMSSIGSVLRYVPAVKIPKGFVSPRYMDTVFPQSFDHGSLRADMWMLDKATFFNPCLTNKELYDMGRRAFYSKNDFHLVQAEFVRERLINAQYMNVQRTRDPASWLDIMAKPPVRGGLSNLDLIRKIHVDYFPINPLAVLNGLLFKARHAELTRVTLTLDPYKYSRARVPNPADIPGVSALVAWAVPAARDLQVFIPARRDAQDYVQMRIK